MKGTLGRIWSSSVFRIGISVVGIVIVVGLILVGTHSASSDSTTTETTAPTAVQVPQLVGLPQTDAAALLKSAGLDVSITTVPGNGTAGIILTQDPAAGKSVEPGTKITLTASAGTPLPTLPSVAGQTVAQAKASLKAAGFGVDGQTSELNSIAPGHVIGTNPAAGTQVPDNASVQLIVSEGPGKTTKTTKPPKVVIPKAPKPPRPTTTTTPRTTTTQPPSTTTPTTS